jgi:hypothetical protein
VRLKLLNPSLDPVCQLDEAIIYSDKPAAEVAMK